MDVGGGECILPLSHGSLLECPWLAQVIIRRSLAIVAVTPRPQAEPETTEAPESKLYHYRNVVEFAARPGIILLSLTSISPDDRSHCTAAGGPSHTSIPPKDGDRCRRRTPTIPSAPPITIRTPRRRVRKLPPITRPVRPPSTERRPRICRARARSRRAPSRRLVRHRFRSRATRSRACSAAAAWASSTRRGIWP